MLSADVRPFESRTPLLLWKSDTKRNNKDNDKNNSSADINTNLFMSLLEASFVACFFSPLSWLTLIKLQITCYLTNSSYSTDSPHNIVFIILILILIIDGNLPPPAAFVHPIALKFFWAVNTYLLCIYLCTCYYLVNYIIVFTCLLACMHAEPCACPCAYLDVYLDAYCTAW